MLIGSKIIELAQVDSTNNYASKLLNESPAQTENGTIIVAKNQYNGKGQQGNAWISETEKNLTFSIIFKPKNISVEKSFYLTICASLAIVESFKNLVNLSIKWPNDIYFKNKKTGGILIENSIEGSRLAHSIIGIGLNINQQIFPSNVENATSLSIIKNKHFNLNSIMQNLIGHLNNLFTELENNFYAKLKNNYLNTLIGYRNIIRLKDDSGEYNGKIIDVEDTGILAVEDVDQKEIKNYMFKEVEFKF